MNTHMTHPYSPIARRPSPDAYQSTGRMAATPTGWRKAPWYAPDARLEQPETSGLEASVRIPLGKPPKKHAHSVALFAMYYNFVRIHKTLRTTPAMAVEEEASTLTAH